MANPEFQKTACALCGGNIEFPATAGGMTVECPHCHQQTELQPITNPVRNLWRLGIFTVLGIALAAAVLVFLKPRVPHTQAVVQPQVAASNAAPVTAEPALPKSAEDLKLAGSISIEKAKGSRLSYAMGTLKNDSDHQRYGVKVEIDLFDQSGNKLPAQANDYLQTLEPRKDWNFRALVLDPKAATAKLSSIKEEP